MKKPRKSAKKAVRKAAKKRAAKAPVVKAGDWLAVPRQARQVRLVKSGRKTLIQSR